MWNMVRVENDGTEKLCGMYGWGRYEFYLELAERIRNQLAASDTTGTYILRRVQL